MTQPTTCDLCGKPLDEHFLTLYDGVAHAGTYGLDGSQQLCTRLYADIANMNGRAQTLFGVARSLKNIAGRMRHAGNPGCADRVRRYAESRVREGEAASARAAAGASCGRSRRLMTGRRDGAMMDAMEIAVKTEKRCPRCGTVYPLVDAEGKPLAREQLMFDRIKAARYRDGERLRSICKACHSADVSRRLTEKKPAAAPDARPGLSNPQAAELAGVSISTIARAKRAGQLPHELTVPAVEAWVRERAAELVGASPLEAVQGALEADRVEAELVRSFFAPAGVAE